MRGDPWTSRVLPVLILIGFLLSSYAYYVEHRFESSRALGVPYRAYCDIGMFSCTKVFSSEYGSLTQKLGLPKVSNAMVGMVFYLVHLAVCRFPALVLAMSAMSCVASVGLFIVLTGILHDLCIVCISTYVVNFATFFCALHWKKQRDAKSSNTAGNSKVSKRRQRK